MIPNAIITKIEANLFDSCKALESFDIPNTVTEIGGAAFASCISLKHLSIPEKVNKIAYWVFNGCTSMEYFICLPVVPPVLTNPDSFNNTNNCPIYVPESSVSAYKTAENWSKHASRIKLLSEFIE